MKLTQNDIATIEQAHDYLLDKVKLRFNVPLLSRLRDLSNGMINKMDNPNDTLFILSKKEILEAYKNSEKLKEFAKEAFTPELEVGKWYKVLNGNDVCHHFYITEFITQKEFKCYGFEKNGSFFEKTEARIVNDVTYQEANILVIARLFKNEAIKRGLIGKFIGHLRFERGRSKCIIDGKIVFANGIWLDENTDINNLIDQAKELEKKHSLKITVTFE